MKTSHNEFAFTASSTNAADTPENNAAERLAFAQRLKRLLHDRDMMQVDLARGLGVGRDIVSKYCSGKNFPSRSNLRKLAEILGVEPGDLAAGHIIGNYETFLSPPEAATMDTRFEIKQLPDGKAMVRMQQVLPWNIALQIADLIAKPLPT